MEEGAGTRFAVQYVLWKAHVGCVSRVHYQLEENRLRHLQEEIIDCGSDQFLAFNGNGFFSWYQRKLSNLVTSEILCIGRKSRQGFGCPNRKRSPLSLPGTMRREKSFPLLSWRSHSSAVWSPWLCCGRTQRLPFCCTHPVFL